MATCIQPQHLHKHTIINNVASSAHLVTMVQQLSAAKTDKPGIISAAATTTRQTSASSFTCCQSHATQ
jgi:hypothetical protein